MIYDLTNGINKNPFTVYASQHQMTTTLVWLAYLLAGEQWEPKILPEDPRSETEDYVLVDCNTTAGYMSTKIFPAWAPVGAARFLELVDGGFLDGQALWRAIPGFLVQFGIPSSREKRDAARALRK